MRFVVRPSKSTRRPGTRIREVIYDGGERYLNLLRVSGGEGCKGKVLTGRSFS